MKKLCLLVLTLLASSAYAQSTSSTWIDVTAPPYSAKNDCSLDAGPPINSAIAGAPAGNGVIFFPTGCYLINTTIVDTNSAAWLTYLGEGNTMLYAKTGFLPSYLMSFGNGTISVGFRKIKNLFFNGNNNARCAVLNGLYNSEFYDVTFAHCTFALLTNNTGNANNSGNRFFGGAIFTGNHDWSGISLGQGADSSSFFGTRFIGPGTGSSQSAISFDAFNGAFYGVEVSGWRIGIDLEEHSLLRQGGIVISGSYFSNNFLAAIQVGGSAAAGERAAGVSITGNYIDCSNLTTNGSANGIAMTSVDGYTISGNQIRQCPGYSIEGAQDSGNAGADGGFVGPNAFDPGANVYLGGSNTTVTSSPIPTKTSTYILTGADSQVNASGNITIYVPCNMIGQHWSVFNSGTVNVSLNGFPGSMNGQSGATLTPQTGMTVVAAGNSNCFALN